MKNCNLFSSVDNAVQHPGDYLCLDEGKTRFFIFYVNLSTNINLCGFPLFGDLYYTHPNMTHHAYQFIPKWQCNTMHTNWFWFPWWRNKIATFCIFSQVFRTRTPPEAIDLVSRLLEYTPGSRISPLQACAHTFFNELREPNTRLPNGRDLPPLFNFTEQGKIHIFLNGFSSIIYFLL